MKLSRALPIVVICTSIDNAKDIYKCQEVIKHLNLAEDPLQVLAMMIIQSEEAAAVLRNVSKFYPVITGMPTGIYLS